MQQIRAHKVRTLVAYLPVTEGQTASAYAEPALLNSTGG